MPKKPDIDPAVTDLSPEESHAANLAILKQARAIAVKIFGSAPKDSILGAAEILRQLDEELTESSIRAAFDVVKKIAPEVTPIPADVYSVVMILIEYEKGEEYLTAALTLAKEWFGDNAIDLFYEIYGEDEEVFEN